eukprot:TRINITY_DN31973_c0_g1_i1.p3 TRINITY_DN31973_c0_g1~~TRINITY_DN31973_c0_g1_i1.p3  ORF type:complete len:136 (-),score=44.78 TRINITY_DN31973_c0_g1_i1:607-1014(-)
MCIRDRRTVELVCKWAPGRVLSLTQDGYSALELAAFSEQENCQVVEVLLRARASVVPANKYGVTALMLAAKNLHSGVVKQMVDANADLDAVSKEGWSALAIAEDQGAEGAGVAEQLRIAGATRRAFGSVRRSVAE